MSGYDWTRPYRYDPNSQLAWRWDPKTKQWVGVSFTELQGASPGTYTNPGGPIYRFDPQSEVWLEYDPAVPGGWKQAPSAVANPGGQSTPGGAAAPGAGPPAPPDPYQNWLKSDANTRTYRYFDEGAQEFYESNPTNAWGQYVSAMFGDRATPFLNYAQGKYSQYYNEYLKNSEANAGAQTSWSQSLTQKNADDIRRAFGMEVASVRGVTNPFMPSGRFTG